MAVFVCANATDASAQPPAPKPPAAKASGEQVDAIIPGCDKLQPAAPGSKPAAPALKEAKERYERGRQLYGDRAFEQSLLEFERAYELAPAYRILYNIAQVAMVLNDHPKAICAFDGYLAHGKIPAKRKAEVQKELVKLRGRVAYLDIKANVDGAEIVLDDLEIGTSPIAKPVMVNAGRHRVTAKLAGRIPSEDSVTLAGQDRATITLELKKPTGTTTNIVTPVPTPVPGQPVPAPVTPPEKTSYVWVGWVVTGVLTAAAVGVGIGALTTADTLGDLREQKNVTATELDDQQGLARGLGIATDALIAGAVVAGAVTLYYQITESDEGDVALTVSPSSIGLSGQF